MAAPSSTSRTGGPVRGAYRAPRVPSRTLRRDVRSDGWSSAWRIPGALVAEALTAAGPSVALIDRRGPMLGSTAATDGARCSTRSTRPLTRPRGEIGRERAERAWRRSRLAAATSPPASPSSASAAGRRRGARSISRARCSTAAGLAGEAAARRAAGIHADFLDRRSLRARYGIDRGGAILSQGNLALDPRKLTAGCAPRRRGARGCSRRSRRPASAFRRRGGRRDGGRSGDPAGHVVLATGYELADPVPAAGTG